MIASGYSSRSGITFAIGDPTDVFTVKPLLKKLGTDHYPVNIFAGKGCQETLQKIPVKYSDPADMFPSLEPKNIEFIGTVLGTHNTGILLSFPKSDLSKMEMILTAAANYSNIPTAGIFYISIDKELFKIIKESEIADPDIDYLPRHAFVPGEAQKEGLKKHLDRHNIEMEIINTGNWPFEIEKALDAINEEILRTMETTGHRG